MVTFGYNIDAASISYERAIEAMRASKADCHLVMVDNRTFFYQQGEIDTIKKYCAALPNTTIIVRLFNNAQSDWKKYPHALEDKASKYQENWAWAKQQLGIYANRVAFDDPCNEPNLAPANHPDAALYAKRCIALIEAASAAGIKLAIGAFSVGSLQEDSLSTIYKPLWEALKRHKQAISWHLYGAIPFEAGETAPLSIVLNATHARAYMKDERWSMAHQGWLMAESYRVIQLCEAMGFTPEIYISECIVDNVLGQAPEIKEAWRAKYGLDMFMRDPRGVRTWSKYLEEFFRADGLDFQQGLAKLLQHARKNIFYHPAFKGACLFALNAQWDYGYEGRMDGTNKHAGSNYDRPEFSLFRSELLSKVNTEIMTTPIPPTTAVPFPALTSPLWENGTLTLGDSTNLRSQPTNTSNNVVKTLPAGSYKAKQFPETKLADGYTWYAYVIEQANQPSLNGWVARRATTTWQKEIVIPPPQVEREYFVDVLGGGTLKVKEHVLDALIEVKRLELEGLRIIRSAPQVE